ncbi:hypothetical protein ZHAS_00021024 [Anopheles sinensis]|uniref:Uncharacterized protein n=1 Tax=Anopheles sinensis TaxID=74873 RepID=A0A084WRB7_ANOSI|nr:hypothetical protein ZHAS_00021024 [Anopheles sinensis]
MIPFACQIQRPEPDSAPSALTLCVQLLPPSRLNTSTKHRVREKIFLHKSFPKRIPHKPLQVRYPRVLPLPLARVLQRATPNANTLQHKSFQEPHFHRLPRLDGWSCDVSPIVPPWHNLLVLLPFLVYSGQEIPSCHSRVQLPRGSWGKGRWKTASEQTKRTEKGSWWRASAKEADRNWFPRPSECFDRRRLSGGPVSEWEGWDRFSFSFPASSGVEVSDPGLKRCHGAGRRRNALDQKPFELDPGRKVPKTCQESAPIAQRSRWFGENRKK